MSNKLAKLLAGYRQDGINFIISLLIKRMKKHYRRNIPYRFYNKSKISHGGIEAIISITCYEDWYRVNKTSEDDLIEEVISQIEAGDVFWDVGANIGTYSLLAAQKNATVIAFEPDASARSRLHRNKELNGVNIEIHSIALSDTSETKVLRDEWRSGLRSIVDDPSEEGELVQCKRGDDLDVPSPDIVKIDVEGHELSVLHGLAEILNGVKACYVEVHQGVDNNQISSVFEKSGFDIIEFGNAGSKGLVKALRHDK